MINFIIGVLIYMGMAAVMKTAGLGLTDWQYWAVPLLAIAAETNERFRNRS